MPFAHKRLALILHYLLALAFTVIPLAVFSLLVRAEGPLAALYILTALCISCIFFGRSIKGPVQKLCFLLSVLLGLAAVCIVLVQVNVSRRSLAEAWLELARSGRAFGFFSFFAAEIYALFCIAQGNLLCMKKWKAFILCALAANSLCAGIILNVPALLVLSLLSAFLFFLLSPSGSTDILRRLKSVSFPLAGGILLSIALMLLNAYNPGAAHIFKTPDFTAFFIRFAPSFPLIRDIPGYGISMGEGEMPSSVTLSNRTLFAVRGEPYSVHYLSATKYVVWNGVFWLEDTNEGDLLPYGYFGDEGIAPLPGAALSGSTLALELVEDFYSSIPIELNTERVELSSDAPVKIKATRNKGLRFEPSARRGLKAALIPGAASTSSEDASFLSTYANPGGERSLRISALARDLTADGTGPEKDRRYIQNLLDYFSTGYTYSLQAGKKQKKESAIEHFLFTEKKGFCLYFASAFVLLAREGGIPARMAEGFRVSLDEKGSGTISGNNAHAWPEVYLDGAWRLFEPTPAFTQTDPFAYSKNSDSETKRQLEALFGPAPAAAKKTGALINWTPFFALPAAGLALFSIIRVLLNRGTKKLRRKAARLVRRCRKKGVPGPEITGWTAWANAACIVNPKADVHEISRIMIELAFSEKPLPTAERIRQALRG